MAGAAISGLGRKRGLWIQDVIGGMRGHCPIMETSVVHTSMHSPATLVTHGPTVLTDIETAQRIHHESGDSQTGPHTPYKTLMNPHWASAGALYAPSLKLFFLLTSSTGGPPRTELP